MILFVHLKNLKMINNVRRNTFWVCDAFDCLDLYVDGDTDAETLTYLGNYPVIDDSRIPHPVFDAIQLFVDSMRIK